MRMIGILAMLTAGAIAGCGSSTSSDNINNNGGNTACTVTLSGAISSTSACTVSANYGLDVIGRSDFSILSTGPGFTLGIQTDGKLAAGTFTTSSPSVEMATTTASNGGLLWSQDTRDPVHGTVSVNLTSSSLGSDGFTLTVHGTVDGTLTPSGATPSASGTVTVHVAF